MMPLLESDMKAEGDTQFGSKAFDCFAEIMDSNF